MISGNDIELFYKLLESLSTSLKELAVRYELISREAGDRERLAGALHSLAEKVMPLVHSISTDSRDAEQRLASLQSAVHDLTGISKALQEKNSHFDMHFDNGDKSLKDIGEDLKSAKTVLDALRSEMSPVIEVASVLQKPLTWVLLAWSIFAAFMAVWKGVEWAGDKFYHKDPPAAVSTSRSGSP